MESPRLLDVYEKQLVRQAPRISDDRQEFFLKKAAHVALKSGMAHAHGTVVVLNNEIISTGFNQNTINFSHLWSIHSEVDALRKIRKNVDLSNAEMYVVRIGKDIDNPLKMSRPCTGCQNFILKRGIGKVYYSYSEVFDYGEFKNTKLKKK